MPSPWALRGRFDSAEALNLEEAAEAVGGGVSIAASDALGEAARALINASPAICVFFKPRMSGKRHVKELADSVVITWDITGTGGRNPGLHLGADGQPFPGGAAKERLDRFLL